MLKSPVAGFVDLSPAAAADMPASIAGMLDRQKRAFLADMMPSADVRRGRLDALERLIVERQEVLSAAINADFGRRDAVVTGLTEVMPVRSALRHARSHLKAWMRPRRAGVGWAFVPASAKLIPQPLGVVGIVAPWNYPLQLLLSPLVDVLAAGNRAMLKPSELTPHFAETLKEAVASYFEPDVVTVVTGGPEVAAAFVALPFDHLVFTGSTAVGRKVAAAAAANLTPLTLELGGKSPAIIDASADLKIAAKRLVWGKLLNSGQTCIAPDYALVPRAMESDFIAAVKAAVAAQYPSFAENADYTSIISDRHKTRLVALVDDAAAKGGEVILLGEGAGDRRVLAPVIIRKAGDSMRVMQEEIFGPILPVMTYETLDEAISYVNGHDRPLALYWFGEDRAARDRVLTGTIAGGVSINDTLVHIAQHGLPFGGVGPSGYGHYHGEQGFRAFSKDKPVLFQSRFSSGGLMYPPYGGLMRRLLSLLERFA